MIIAIGALGGSGTRAIAEVLIQSGIYMGDDLNGPNDNLVFTRLFKNPDWYKKSESIQKKNRMRIFEKYMKGNKLSTMELYRLIFASATNPIWNSNISFYLRIMKRVFDTTQKARNWGWKEPNTQIYMSEFLDFFQELKYIHVLRHGLDMAYSDNKQQLKNWGWKYNIVLNGNETDDEVAVKQLDYWIESTKDVITKSKKYNNRFLLINHTDFCNHPKFEIDKLLDFTGIEVSKSKKEKLYSIPQNTGSNNRYLEKDLNIFDSKKIEYVQSVGFEI
jgi:hypothetical protein